MDLRKINIKIPQRIYQEFLSCENTNTHHLFEEYKFSTVWKDSIVDMKIENDDGNPWYKIIFCINSIYEKIYYFNSLSELFTIFRLNIDNKQYLINIEKEKSSDKLVEKKFNINLIQNYNLEPINILNKIICTNFNNDEDFYETCFILINNSEKINNESLELFKSKSIYQGYDFGKRIKDILFQKSLGQFQVNEEIINIIFLLSNNKLSNLKKCLLKTIGNRKCKICLDNV